MELIFEMNPRDKVPGRMRTIMRKEHCAGRHHGQGKCEMLCSSWRVLTCLVHNEPNQARSPARR
jgi:hypothetical protein